MDSLASQLYAFASVVVIDLVLAGDNAVVVGMAASGLPREQQRRVIMIGIVLALACRIVFAVVAVQLLEIIGLLFAGGLLLLWVSWKMWRELHPPPAVVRQRAEQGGHVAKSRGTAIFQIALADISMSLDNVLAVAGAARDHMAMLIFGLVLSIALMGAAASVIARFLERYRWLNYIGLAIITFVAVTMIWEGSTEIWTAIAAT
jgi:YjbE family integral membrane protein